MAASPAKQHQLADYVIIIGLDSQSVPVPSDEKGLIFDSKVLAKFPEKEVDFLAHINLFAFPQGVHVTSTAPAISTHFHHFVLTGLTGDRLYGVAFHFYQSVG
eukprot:TRINITY_DN12374_c0_g1_i2.p1 TRINITY_DN12374_c0_g1~~TRINITY_DN12374_c0_g1_i2.p1  ORF type:complete len:103 (+),score=5.70 TRINITY_DN12374_c0_g1_i2:118-426(+)